MKKTLLVSGAAGFIGSNLVRRLIEVGSYRVIGLDKLTYAGNLVSIQDVLRSPDFIFEQMDICDGDSLDRVFERYQPHGVMHLAAESHVDRSIDGPGQFVETNIVGTYRLLQASRRYLLGNHLNGFRFLHVSTDEVYGSLGFDEKGFTEQNRYQPHSPYSASKAASDHLVRAWGDTYGLPILVTNCSNNYGPYQFPEKLLPVVILSAIRGEPIPVYGDGLNVRDWLYVVDHCNAIRLVFELGRPGETYNIGGNNEQSNIALVRRICCLLDKKIPLEGGKSYQDQIVFVADRPGHDRRYAIDSTKIREELGWEASEDSETGFLKTVEWYLANQSWWTSVLSGDYRRQRIGLGKEGAEE